MYLPCPSSSPLMSSTQRQETSSSSSSSSSACSPRLSSHPSLLSPSPLQQTQPPLPLQPLTAFLPPLSKKAQVSTCEVGTVTTPRSKPSGELAAYPSRKINNITREEEDKREERCNREKERDEEEEQQNRRRRSVTTRGSIVIRRATEAASGGAISSSSSSAGARKSCIDMKEKDKEGEREVEEGRSGDPLDEKKRIQDGCESSLKERRRLSSRKPSPATSGGNPPSSSSSASPEGQQQEQTRRATRRKTSILPSPPPYLTPHDRQSILFPSNSQSTGLGERGYERVGLSSSLSEKERNYEEEFMAKYFQKGTCHEQRLRERGSIIMQMKGVPVACRICGVHGHTQETCRLASLYAESGGGEVEEIAEEQRRERKTTKQSHKMLKQMDAWNLIGTDPFNGSSTSMLHLARGCFLQGDHRSSSSNTSDNSSTDSLLSSFRDPSMKTAISPHATTSLPSPSLLSSSDLCNTKSQMTRVIGRAPSSSSQHTPAVNSNPKCKQQSLVASTTSSSYPRADSRVSVNDKNSTSASQQAASASSSSSDTLSGATNMYGRMSAFLKANMKNSNDSSNETPP
ncbi:hypothetical protein CSUI_001841 [Cystoisospora suis]|uniref:Uncharacterized protein n=1 Tax=Cystoisospora suis TaxID=483139 RepID=A0A2C6KW25_9APIC|nr:hypothetical protein CSUI_001841 [Cystoisospora suis]